MKTASIPTLPAASARVVAAFRQAVQRELAQRSDGTAPEALLWAAAQASRGLLADRWARTQAADRADRKSRRVHYLSMEFLMGRALRNAVSALGLDDALRQACADAGTPLPDVLEREADAALGNGGLGRLAACFLDSFATLGLPSFGYGVRYQYGMFAQQIAGRAPDRDADDWLQARQPVGDPAPGAALDGRLRRQGAGRRHGPRMDAGRASCGHGVRLHRARPRHRARGHAAPVARVERAPDRLRGVLPWRAPGVGPGTPGRRR
jgi:starch phosphorylase